jgi:leader peptidase (prepilin peptidase)/N-methyltransferase
MMDFVRDDWRLIRLALLNPATWAWWLVGGLWAWAFAGGNLAVFWPLLGLAGLMAVVALADLETHLLPLLPIALLAVAGLWLNPLPRVGVDAWLGAGLAAAGMAGLGWLSGKLAGKPALGGGDVWLALALGAWLGLVGLVPWLSAIAVLGLVMLLVRRVRGQRGALPFGPILLAAGWLALLHGQLYYAVILP